MFKGNSPIKLSPLPGWDIGVTSQYTALLYKLLCLFRKRGKKVVSWVLKTLRNVLSVRG